MRTTHPNWFKSSADQPPQASNPSGQATQQQNVAVETFKSRNDSQREDDARQQQQAKTPEQTAADILAMQERTIPAMAENSLIAYFDQSYVSVCRAIKSNPDFVNARDDVVHHIALATFQAWLNSMFMSGRSGATAQNVARSTYLKRVLEEASK